MTMALRWCRPQTRALLERWRSDMVDAAKARHITPDGRSNWTVTDQLALSLIFAASPHPMPCRHHSCLHGDTPGPLPQAAPSLTGSTQDAMACPCSSPVPLVDHLA